MAHALFLSGKDDKDGDLMNKLALINIETMKLAKKKGKFLKVLWTRLEPSCCKKRQKKSQPRNWFGE
jgi:hypothetical protein